MDCSLPGSSVHGIFQARILEWVAISFSRGSSRPRDQIHITCISHIGRQILYHCTTLEAQQFISEIILLIRLSCELNTLETALERRDVYKGYL